MIDTRTAGARQPVDRARAHAGACQCSLGALGQRLGLHRANGGWEYPAFLIAMSLVLALLGDGRYALANRLERRNLSAVPA